MGLSVAGSTLLTSVHRSVMRVLLACKMLELSEESFASSWPEGNAKQEIILTFRSFVCFQRITSEVTTYRRYEVGGGGGHSGLGGGGGVPEGFGEEGPHHSIAGEEQPTAQ